LVDNVPEEDAPIARPILVVDDDDGIRELISVALSEEGYAVVTARNGQEALDQVAVYAPGLILLDLWMPVLDGEGFLRAYYARVEAPVPVILLAAATNAAAVAVQSHADAFLAKPFDLGELLAIVDEHMPEK
jgi:DNA-binding response OmpR family regulator